MKKLLGAVLHIWSESEESTFQNKNITNLTSWNLPNNIARSNTK